MRIESAATHWVASSCGDIVFTFLNKRQIKNLFKKFKKTIIGLEEHNYINIDKMHSFWIITVQK